MRRLLVYMWPYRATVAVSLVFLLINSVLQILGPLLTKLAVDRFLAPVNPPVPTPLDPYLSSDPWIGLTQVSAVFLVAIGFGMVLEVAQGYLMQRTGQLAMFDLRRDLITHLQKLDIAYYDRNPVGRLVTRVTTDVDVLNELFSSGLVTILGDVLVLSLVLLAMFQLSPGMTGLLLAAMPLVIVATLVFRRSVAQSYRRIRIAVAKINAYIQEHVSGITVLQLFNREQRSREEFDNINRDHMAAYKDAIFAYGWFYPVVELLSMAAIASLLAYGGFRIRSGELTLGVLVAFFQYGLRFFRPIQDLSEKFNILQSAMAAAERVFKLLDTQPAVSAPAAPRKFPESAAAIEFDRVWFAYKALNGDGAKTSGDGARREVAADDQWDWVLRDVSFTIAPGETIAVVGHTGAGKTTLTNLLLRFYDVQRGSIRIGGVDVREFEPRQLRRRFGIVLQDPYLFTGTIEENIRLGTDGIDHQRLLAACQQVNLKEFLDSLPNGVRQEVLERGASLSTGQKQLISFARALAHNPRYLILDEATSSVDTETEFRVREALGRLIEGRTSIVIAHRLSTIQRADRILVMHKGRLRESGTHQQLLAARGIYWKLYELQYKYQESREAQPAPAEPRS